MTRWDHTLYREEIAAIAAAPLPWESLSGKTLVISGATGLLGCVLIDTLAYLNEYQDLGCKVFALTRDPKKAATRAIPSWDSTVKLTACNINLQIPEIPVRSDYVIHAASNTHPIAYATDPIGTIMTNISGTQNMLELAACHKAKRVLFLSSVEIYGENRGDCEAFDESYCGFLDCNTLRAGYPEGKRAGEALCQAYIRQKGLDIVMPRLCRLYGPTLLSSDTKALSQFLRNALSGQDIVLKSEGGQYYSYCYAADAVSALFYCLIYGKCGEAYNIADSASNITLRSLAELIASCAGTHVVFNLPGSTEKAGFSKATKAILDSSKLQALGWKAAYPIQEGIRRTLSILS